MDKIQYFFHTSFAAKGSNVFFKNKDFLLLLDPTTRSTALTASDTTAEIGLRDKL